jgi:hypothetical protein
MAFSRTEPSVMAAPATVAPDGISRPLDRLIVPKKLPPLVDAVFVVLACLVTGAAAVLLPAAGPVAVLALGVGYFLLRRPVLTLFLVVAVVPATNGLRRGLPIPGMRLSEALIVVGALAFLANPPRRAPKWTAVDRTAFAYVVVAVVFGIVNLARRGIDPLPSLPLILATAQFFLLYRIVVGGAATSRLRAVSLRVLLLASLPVSLLGIAQGMLRGALHQFLIGLTATDVFDPLGYEPTFRITSVFAIWHGLAGYLAVQIFLCVALLLAGDRRVLSAPWLLIVLTTAVGALALTISITPTAAVAVGVVLLGFWYRRGILVLALLAAVSGAGFALFRDRILDRASQQAPDAALAASVPSWLPQTAQFRVYVWEEQFVPSMSGRWITGFGGYGYDLPPNVTWQFTESDYITLLLRGGWGLMLLYVALVLMIIAYGWKCQKAVDGVDRAIVRVTVVITALLLVLSFIWPYFTSGGLAQPLWLMWGLTMAVDAHARRRPSVASPFLVPPQRRPTTALSALLDGVVAGGGRDPGGLHDDRLWEATDHAAGHGPYARRSTSRSRRGDGLSRAVLSRLHRRTGHRR